MNRFDQRLLQSSTLKTSVHFTHLFINFAVVKEMPSTPEAGKNDGNVYDRIQGLTAEVYNPLYFGPDNLCDRLTLALSQSQIFSPQTVLLKVLIAEPRLRGCRQKWRRYMAQTPRLYNGR